MRKLKSIEICAGAGGQALGLEMAGFQHIALVEIEPDACRTLNYNRPAWNVVEGDVKYFSATKYKGIALLAGGVPCPPFSIAGKQLGAGDERDLFPEMLRLVQECDPTAIMIENVRGILDAKFSAYRTSIIGTLNALGYWCEWRLLNAADFGVPQSRPRAILVALRREFMDYFRWPEPLAPPLSVGEALYSEISRLGWEKASEWKALANGIAPTLVGGSRKHGGPDLGPTRAKQAWAKLGVDGHGVVSVPPSNGFSGMPRLTVQMAAILQGFPTSWTFAGCKTSAYRQVGNAFPPPVAEAVGEAIALALEKRVKWVQETASAST